VTNAIVPSSLSGLPDAGLDGVAFRNVTVNMEPPRSGKAAEKPYVFNVGPHVDVTIDGLTVNWHGH